GVVVWGARDGGGMMKVVAKVAIAIPSRHHAQYAETLGCSVALGWIAGSSTDERTVRVFGDNERSAILCGRRRPSTA
ncbi:MAG: hypothetical protein ACKPKO_14565, partial [Candidatus Fonsibacter sp.]